MFKPILNKEVLLMFLSHFLNSSHSLNHSFSVCIVGGCSDFCVQSGR